jgi:hypothetical protein
VKSGIGESDAPLLPEPPEPDRPGHVDFAKPEVVLSVLEADQVVAAKKRMHFGKRKLSAGIQWLFWGLRVYVIVMLVIVLLSVLRALHGTG